MAGRFIRGFVFRTDRDKFVPVAGNGGNLFLLIYSRAAPGRNMFRDCPLFGVLLYFTMARKGVFLVFVLQ